MRVLVVGLGSIGRRHLANIRALEPDAQIFVLRHSRKGDQVPSDADRVIYSLDDALQFAPDLAFICGPTAKHAEIGVPLVRAGAHLFVEKPLASDSTGASVLVEAANVAGKAIVVGYNLRFLRSLRALRASLEGNEIGRPMTVRAEVGQYLPDWRPGVDYRQTNSARTDLGGGIEFELSHEIDYVCWLLGGRVRSVTAVLARTSDLEIDVDDTAELILKFQSGAIASIHMDMTQRVPVRTCRIAGTEGTLIWDAIAGEVRRYRPCDGWVRIHESDGDRNDMYIDEVAHVFAVSRGEVAPIVDGRAALSTVQIAEAARRSSDEARQVEL